MDHVSFDTHNSILVNHAIDYLRYDYLACNSLVLGTLQAKSSQRMFVSQSESVIHKNYVIGN